MGFGFWVLGFVLEGKGLRGLVFWGVRVTKYAHGLPLPVSRWHHEFSTMVELSTGCNHLLVVEALHYKRLQLSTSKFYDQINHQLVDSWLIQLNFKTLIIMEGHCDSSEMSVRQVICTKTYVVRVLYPAPG